MFEISRTVVSMSTAGVLVIVAGIAARRNGLTRGSLTDRAIALGRVFVAAPLATFGALHLAAANGLMGMVPTYHAVAIVLGLRRRLRAHRNGA